MKTINVAWLCLAYLPVTQGMSCCKAKYANNWAFSCGECLELLSGVPGHVAGTVFVQLRCEIAFPPFRHSRWQLDKRKSQSQHTSAAHQLRK